MRVTIRKEILDDLKTEACKSFPNECVGFFIAADLDSVISIEFLRPCKNISKNKSIGSEVSRKTINKITKECRDLNKKAFDVFVVGQYHSHPTTGTTIQSDVDKSAGKKWKEYRMQLIMGLRGKNLRVIKTKFYCLDKKSGAWKALKISIKR